MIFGIGTDIVSIKRMEQALERHGEPFARRVLSHDEFVEYQASKQTTHFLAKRFAAKEAAAKALGTGFRDGISLKDISVEHTSVGQPLLSFSGKAKDMVSQSGITGSHLSISDEKEYAVAFVTLVMEKD